MGIMMDLAVLAMGFGTTAGVYKWSTKHHFQSDNVTQAFGRLRGLVKILVYLFAGLVLLYDQPLWMQLAGLSIQIVSMALFLWAIKASKSANLRFVFDLEVPRGLATTGPYRYVRHPFYTSYILFWTGYALNTGIWWTAIPVIFFAYVYTKAARQEERLFGQTEMAAQYDDYRSRTGFMFPTVSGFRTGLR